jgi:hypothetical protein
MPDQLARDHLSASVRTNCTHMSNSMPSALTSNSEHGWLQNSSSFDVELTMQDPITESREQIVFAKSEVDATARFRGMMALSIGGSP